MKGHPEVALLLATYNGAQFVEQQIRSLTQNSTAFTLHWLDDHSRDNTREIVRRVAKSARIDLREWHQAQHEGVPGAFFRLLECVSADVYLFCDQDDIWQPGKIEATVATLTSDITCPAICFSDPLMFRNENPDDNYRVLDVLKTTPEAAMQESRVFTPVVGYGHTEGFTRPLRDIFMKHNDIARTYAFLHDMWMYAIGVASGTAKLLSNVPTTLFRSHARNATGEYWTWKGEGRGHMAMTWEQQQKSRRGSARHAEGFILASPTLPSGPKLERLLETARLVARLDRRQPPTALFRLARHGILWPNRRLALSLALACLCSDARRLS
jgi:glycosyltransferase involved in cell wall biosynthesis